MVELVVDGVLVWRAGCCSWPVSAGGGECECVCGLEVGDRGRGRVWGKNILSGLGNFT